VLVDLSHRIVAAMTTYPGLPGPELTDYATRADTAARMAPGVSFHIGRICMVANTGTYIDMPFHFYEHGDDLSAVTLDRIAQLDAVVIDHRNARALTAAAFNGIEVTGRAVIIRTGWSRHFGTETYGQNAPFLADDAVAALVARRAALVGIDSVNIDDIGDLRRPAHVGLLGAGIPIVEHLRGLESLPNEGFRFTAAPPMVSGMGTFPVRAFAELA
jgi:arylformamidase